MKNKLGFALLLCIFSSNALATEYIVRDAKITSISSTHQRPEVIGLQDVNIVSFANNPAWTTNIGSGGTLCENGSAVIPKDNKFMESVALSALVSQANVIVVVDNTLPMTSTYCQIAVINITSN